MAFAEGDFRRLIEAHQRMVFSIALRVTGDYATAEEVAQDVFLALYRSSEKISGDDHARFWLRRVAVHRATDALRRRAVRPEAGAEEWDESYEGQRSDGIAVSSVVSNFAIEARLDELLRGLPEAMRVAVVLRYQEEMLPEEIAAMLGQPVATVKSHLQRALKLLRRKAAVTMKEYVREPI
jgi:RNA polymerase sigma-70 factor (ECF subfamily)